MMQISLLSADAGTKSTDLLALGVVRDGLESSPLFAQLNRALGGELGKTARDLDFTGKANQQMELASLGKTRAKRIALVGLGPQEQIDARGVLRGCGAATRIASRFAATDMVVVMPLFESIETTVELASRGVVLGEYRYDKYRSNPDKRPTLDRVAIAIDGGKKIPPVARASIRRGRIIAEAIITARDLVNESPSDLYPESFAKRAALHARRAGLKCKVMAPKDLERMKMGLLMAVGQGSVRSPRLVHLEYEAAGGKAKGKKKSKKKGKNVGPVVLVGKGITFDSGGLNLKPSANMVDMKADMAGAAAVLATMIAIARLKPQDSVHGVLALAENMPSGSAVRLGDVVTSAAGKTVEITNTDAEGRLILADALHYCQNLQPRSIIDVATLTGACAAALGPHMMGLFCDDEALATALTDSATRSGELLWRLPLCQELAESLESDVADTKNTGARLGGAIVAALFLQMFAGKAPWAHIDIAGCATSSKAGGVVSKGGTGVTVSTLIELLA